MSFKDPNSHVSNLYGFVMLSSLCECDLHLNESSWWRHEVESLVFKRIKTDCSGGQTLSWDLCFLRFGSFINQFGGVVKATDALSCELVTVLCLDCFSL